MRFFQINLFIVLICASCSLITTEGLRQTAVTKKEIYNPYFSKTTIDYIYKAKIDIYGRYFGGILIVKKVAEDSHRVVFTTEFGSKIFDFLYEGDTFTKNFVLEDLDKKIIVKTLERDFRLLVSEKALVLKQFISERNTIYRTQSERGFNFYFLDTSRGNLKKLVNTSKTKEKVTFVFVPSKGNGEYDIAERITINHSNIKLKIDLNYFKKN